MKKFILLLLSAFITFAFAACGSGLPERYGYDGALNAAENTGDPLPDPTPYEDGAINGNDPVLLSIGELLSVVGKRDLIFNGYDVKKFTSPYYTNQIQYGEGVLVLENADGSIDPIELLYEPAQVFEVRSADLKTLYVQGTDYTVDGEGRIVIGENSRIPSMTRAEFFEAGSDGWLYDNGTEKVAVTNNKTALYAAKIAVTYARAHNRADDFVQENKMSRLTTFKNKIENGEDAKILLIGDSITAGAGVQNFPNWGAMLKDAVEARSESEITLINAGIPGIHSQQYIDLLNGTELTGDAYFLGEVAQKKPLVAAHKATADLIVIAIGGNDAGGWNGATGVNNTVYRNNVKTMIDFFRTANPDCSVMLVSCFQTHDKIWTNGTTKLAAADLKAYAGELATIEFDKGYANSSNLIFADVFSMQENILNVRKAEDLLGDNRNHPDDYMSRIYVQTMVAALFGK